MYSLRTSGLSDFEFCRRVHHATLRVHVEKIWGWNSSRQDVFFKEEFESGQLKVIEAFGADVGYLNAHSAGKMIFLVNLLILPEFQNRGLGTQIMRDLMKQGSVQLGVFKVNENARRLYQSLGFRQNGESETHYLMSSQPET